MRLFRCVPLVLCVGLLPISVSSQVLETIEAKVNGEIVFASELDDAMRAMWFYRTNRSLESMTDEEYLALRMRALKERVKDLLLTQECRKILEERGVDNRLSDREINRLADQEVEQFRAAFSSEEEMRQKMEKSGITEESLRAHCLYLARQKYWLREIAPRVARERVPRVTEEVVAAFKTEHPDQWKELESVQLSHILLNVPENASPEQEASIKEKADLIALRAKAGEDFQALARECSEQEETRKNGGRLGKLRRSQIFPEFEVLFDLPVGKPSDPIRTKLGYHIVLVHDRIIIADVLYRQSISREFDRWIEEIIDRPDTEIYGKGELVKESITEAGSEQIDIPDTAIP
ncbi:MAG TPA: peptidylprolyl isomerase [bacterium]|nr:peptidylprolyl isomerase [bacterium]